MSHEHLCKHDGLYWIAQEGEDTYYSIAPKGHMTTYLIRLLGRLEGLLPIIREAIEESKKLDNSIVSKKASVEAKNMFLIKEDITEAELMALVSGAEGFDGVISKIFETDPSLFNNVRV